MAKKKLGVMLSTHQEHPNKKIVVALVNEAVQQGIETYLYLIDDGVYHLSCPEINALTDAGVRLFACAYGAQQRGIPLNNNKAIFTGLVVLSDMIKGCDRFVNFN